MNNKRFAKGTYSLAVCDRCGLWYAYNELQREWLQYTNIQGTLARTNIRVCRDCLDTDVFIKHVHTDAQALRNPRPDIPEVPVSGPVGTIPDNAGLVWDQGTNTWGPPIPNMGNI